MLSYPGAAEWLDQAAAVICWSDAIEPPTAAAGEGELYVGVDLGTAYLTVVVLDEQMRPLAGESQYAEVARDGLVVDFAGAVKRLGAIKARLEGRLGRKLEHAHSGYPPGVAAVEVRSTAHVVEAAGFVCSGLTDEPSAANSILRLEDGAIVDVGGGTTGIAIIEGGEIRYTADEATGGTHFTLVIAGARNLRFDEAEALKTNPGAQRELLPVVRPVMEKVAAIALKHMQGFSVPEITLVGGASGFDGMAMVIEEYTGIPTRLAPQPMLVTPLGLACRDAYTVREPSF